jgi:capsular exopolysaccharide synthesis family protein
MPTRTIGSSEESANVHTGEPDTRRVLAGLARRTPLIVACTLLTAGAALIFSLHQTKEYTASASLLFRDPGFDQRLFGSSGAPSQDPAREAATNLTLVSLQAVAGRTAATLRGNMTGSEISKKVSVSGRGQSDVASVKATDADPRFAATLANTFAESYIVFRRDADRRKVQQARKLVEDDFEALPPVAQSGSEGQALQRQISRLSTLEALQTGNAELVQRATVPSTPSSPKTVRNTVLGLGLGLLIGVGIALILARFDRRLRQPNDFEDAFGLPVLTEIPENKSLARSNNGLGEPSTMEDGAFQMLRARLRYFNVDRKVSSVLVTSAASGEGKTTIAWNFVVSGASAGLRTILVEADFHQASVATMAGISARPGLSELLSNQNSLAESVQQVRVDDRQNGHEVVRHLDVIVAGSHPPNPVELLESEGMTRLIDTLASDHDLVVIDSPPLSVLADAIPLTRMVDGVIVVGQVNRTTRDQAQALLAQLQNLNAPLLGAVANRTPRRRYGYYYGYGRPSSKIG